MGCILLITGRSWVRVPEDPLRKNPANSAFAGFVILCERRGRACSPRFGLLENRRRGEQARPLRKTTPWWVLTFGELCCMMVIIRIYKWRSFWESSWLSGSHQPNIIEILKEGCRMVKEGFKGLLNGLIIIGITLNIGCALALAWGSSKANGLCAKAFA